MLKEENKTVRENQVQYSHQKSMHGRMLRVPKINLSGKWLKKAGFSHRDKMKIEVTQGKIVIEKQ